MNRTHFLQSLYVGTRKDKHEQSVRCFKKALDPCTSVLRRNGSCVVTLVTFLLQLQALSDGGPVLCDVQTHSIHASFSTNSLAQRGLGVRKVRSMPLAYVVCPLPPLASCTADHAGFSESASAEGQVLSRTVKQVISNAYTATVEESETLCGRRRRGCRRRRGWPGRRPRTTRQRKGTTRRSPRHPAALPSTSPSRLPRPSSSSSPRLCSAPWGRRRRPARGAARTCPPGT